MENANKTQIQVKDLKVGDTVVTLNGDKWKILSMQSSNRAGALTKDGDFFQIVMQGPKNKKMKNVWSGVAKVFVPSS